MEAVGRSATAPAAGCAASLSHSVCARCARGTLAESRPLADAPPNVWHLDEFVSEAESAEILASIDALPESDWRTVHGRQVHSFGGTPLTPPAEMLPVAMPDWVKGLCGTLVAAGVFPADEPPNHVLVNEYEPGRGIPAHKDGPMYMPRVAILSLGSVASFDFVSHGGSSGGAGAKAAVEIRRPVEPTATPATESAAEDAEDDDSDGSEWAHGEWEVVDEDAAETLGTAPAMEPVPFELVHVLHTCHVAASLLLPPRGLLVFGDEAYDDYLHTVPALETDAGRANLVRLDLGHSSSVPPPPSSAPPPPPPPPPPRSRRISLTVRRVVHVRDEAWEEEPEAAPPMSPSASPGSVVEYGFNDF